MRRQVGKRVVGWCVIGMAGAIGGAAVAQERAGAPPTPGTTTQPASAATRPDVAARRAAAEERSRARRAEQAKANAEQARAQDAELQAALAEKRAVVALPTWVRNVYLDSTGQPWFSADAIGEPIASMRNSVLAAAAGQTRVIRWSKPVLRDSRGRLWAATETAAGRVVGSDGKRTWERLVSDLDESKNRGFFKLYGWEDDAGNVYFIGEDHRGIGVHRLTAATDTWEYQNVLSPADARDSFLAGSHLAIVKQAGGRMTVCPSDGARAGECRALHYDGKTWRVLDPTVCPAKDAVQAVVPLPDGGIATVCEHHQLWTYWPDTATGGDADRKRVAALALQLEDADPGSRDKAAAALVAMGPKVAPLVKAAMDDADLPEAKIRLAAVLDSFAAIEAKGGGGAWNRMLYGGRYMFGGVHFASRSRDGRPTFLVDGAADRVTGSRYPAAMATLANDGAWSVRPVDVEQWREDGWTQLPRDQFQDSKGRIYIDDRRRTTADGKLERVTDFGVQVREIIGEDAAGRIYAFGQGKTYILDESAATTTPPKGALELARYAGSFRVFPDDGTLLGCFVDGSDAPLARFAGGQWRPIPGLPEGAIKNSVALRGGGALMELVNPESAHLYDGARWRHAASLIDIVRANPTVLAERAGREFWQFRDVRLAAGPNGTLWYAQSRWEFVGPPLIQNQTYMNRFLYHDGKAWHDVWQETGLPLAEEQNVHLGAVERQSAVLVIVKDEIRRVAFDGPGGAARATAVPKPPDLQPSSLTTWPSPDGTMWMRSGRTGLLYRYADGKVAQSPVQGSPLLVDSKSRLWATAPRPGMLQVEQGGRTAETKIEGFDWTAAMVEAPGGRFIVLHTQGASELRVEGAGAGAFTLREVQRWPWPLPRDRFGATFADRDGYVWFWGGEERLIRFPLPPAGK